MEAAPPSIRTARLVLRAPILADAPVAFATYAGDPESTRLMGWPTHATVDDTAAFFAHAISEWVALGAGVYLIELDGRIIGSSGLHLHPPGRAATGYILGRPWWGHGYATEACRAMVELGRALGLVRVDATCHPDNQASARVLAKAGMTFEGRLRRHGVFPQLGPEPRDVDLYAWIG